MNKPLPPAPPEHLTPPPVLDRLRLRRLDDESADRRLQKDRLGVFVFGMICSIFVTIRMMFQGER